MRLVNSAGRYLSIFYFSLVFQNLFSPPSSIFDVAGSPIVDPVTGVRVGEMRGPSFLGPNKAWDGQAATAVPVGMHQQYGSQYLPQSFSQYLPQSQQQYLPQTFPQANSTLGYYGMGGPLFGGYNGSMFNSSTMPYSFGSSGFSGMQFGGLSSYSSLFGVGNYGFNPYSSGNGIGMPQNYGMTSSSYLGGYFPGQQYGQAGPSYNYGQYSGSSQFGSLGTYPQNQSQGIPVNSPTTIDGVFPQGTDFTITDPASMITSVFSLLMKKEGNAIDYKIINITPYNFPTYSAFCDSLTDILKRATDVDFGETFTDTVDPCSKLLKEVIEVMLWLRYWVNTKEQNRDETIDQRLVKAQASLNYQTQRPVAQNIQSTKSAQQILISLVNNDAMPGVTAKSINVADTVYLIFSSLFKGLNKGISIESIGLGISDTVEERRSFLAVLASMFFDMPNFYQKLCVKNMTTDIFKEVKEILNLESENVSLSGRESILAAQIHAPNKGSYLDSNESIGQNNTQASRLSRYSDPETPALLEVFLNKLNEAKAMLMGGRLAMLNVNRKTNALVVAANLNECVDKLNEIIEQERVANTSLGERLTQVLTPAGLVISSAESSDSLMAEKITFIRSECFITLIWALTHWILIASSKSSNEKFFNFTKFSDTQKAFFELIYKFCSSRNFFLMNFFASVKCKTFNLKPDLFLNKEFEAIIIICLKYFSSAFTQDDLVFRMLAMDRFFTMIKNTPGGKGPWPESTPNVFKNAKAQLINTMKSLLDGIDSEHLPVFKIGRTSNPQVLQKLKDLIEMMRGKEWYNKVFTPDSDLSFSKINEKYQKVCSELEKNPVSISSGSAINSGAVSPKPSRSSESPATFGRTALPTMF